MTSPTFDKVDDSSLFHYAKGYDPEKARAYYLRTRKLKGRPRVGYTNDKEEFKKHATGNEGTYDRPGKPNRSKTKSRQEELRAQKEALEKRLDRLRNVLAELVEAAKKRSGGDPNKKNKADEKDTAPETQVDKADRNKAEKDAKPLTAKQKADKARKAKEEYEKEHPNSLSTDVEILQEQVKDIQAKIQTALADAQARRNKAGQNDSKSGSQNNRTDGPRGR